MRSLIKMYLLTLIISSLVLFGANKIYTSCVNFNLGLGILIAVSFLVLAANIFFAIKLFEKLYQKLLLIFLMPTNYAFFIIIILLFLILNSEGTFDFSNFG